MTRGIKMLLIAPLAIVGIALFIFIGGEIVKLLWNWLVPSLFGLRVLTFWEAVGLLALSRILFGGFGRGFSNARGNASHRSAERRERFRQKIRERFGADFTETSTPGSGSSSDPAPFR